MSVIAIDLGGTKLAGAVFDATGRILRRQVTAVAGRGGGDVALLMRELIDTLARGESVQAIGVAVPGIYQRERGTVWAPNVPGWDDYPLLAELRQVNSAQVAIASDRTCYILGEVWQGNARDARNAIFLAVGTGIGAGILADGRVLHGQNDIAGAIGWLALASEFRPEYEACGCFEHYAAGPGIARAAGVASAEEAFAAFARGDPAATRAIRTAISNWGRAVANLVSLFDPEVIVFGGGVFGPAAALLDDIRAAALEWAQPISMRQVKLCVSALGADAGVYGAAAIAWEAARQQATIVT
ncbi:MAG: ROK family protein [Gemmatimonadota bacterium]